VKAGVRRPDTGRVVRHDFADADESVGTIAFASRGHTMVIALATLRAPWAERLVWPHALTFAPARAEIALWSEFTAARR